MSELEKYKLRYEKPRIKRKWISTEALNEMAKQEKKNNRKKLSIIISTTVNFRLVGLPLALAFTKKKGVVTIFINIVGIEASIELSRVKK